MAQSHQTTSAHASRQPARPVAARSRRRFLADGFQTLVSVALFQSLYARRLVAGSVSSEFAAWVRGLDDACRDLRRSGLSLVQWQESIQALLERIELQELLAAIDFDALEQQLDYPDLGVDTARVRFPDVDGLPDKLAFYPKFFGMQADRAIIPHGHRNMVSAHLIVGGKMHLRQYDRREDEGEALIVEPTVDTLTGPGEASSISDDRNNVHWLIARGGPAYTFDVIVTGVDGPGYDIENLDPESAEPVQGGLLRMPKLSVEEALRRYGKDHHGRDNQNRDHHGRGDGVNR